MQSKHKGEAMTIRRKWNNKSKKTLITRGVSIQKSKPKTTTTQQQIIEILESGQQKKGNLKKNVF